MEDYSPSYSLDKKQKITKLAVTSTMHIDSNQKTLKSISKEKESYCPDPPISPTTTGAQDSVSPMTPPISKSMPTQASRVSYSGTRGIEK